MVAEKIDGTSIARSIRERINNDIAERQKINPRFKPSLSIIQGMSPWAAETIAKTHADRCDYSWREIRLVYVSRWAARCLMS